MTTLYDPISISAYMSICICALHIFIQFLSCSFVALVGYGRKPSGAPHFHSWPPGYLVQKRDVGEDETVRVIVIK
jgi:hypothetical protein